MTLAMLVQLISFTIVRRRIRNYHFQRESERAAHFSSHGSKDFSSMDTFSAYSIIQSFEKALRRHHELEQDSPIYVHGVQEMPFQSGNQEEPAEKLESTAESQYRPHTKKPKYYESQMNARRVTKRKSKQISAATGPVKAIIIPI